MRYALNFFCFQFVIVNISFKNVKRNYPFKNCRTLQEMDNFPFPK